MGVAASGLDNTENQLLQSWNTRINEVKNAKSLIKQQHDESVNFTKRQLGLQERSVRASERASPSELTIQLRNLLLKFIEKAIPYVVLLLFLLCLYLVLTGGFGGSSSSSSSSSSNSVAEMKKYELMIRNQFSGVFGTIYLYFHNIWQSLTVPPQIKLVMNTFSQYKDGGPTVPRTLINSGRCDNIQWIETTADGQMGTCASAIRPKDLTWTLKPSSNPELNGEEFTKYADANKIDKKQWLNNTNVIIPWDRSPETTFFVPQCEQAYFANQCRPANNGTCAPNEHWAHGYCCVKANLLKEQGLTCGLKSFSKGTLNTQSNIDKDVQKNPEYEDIVKTNKRTIPENSSLDPTFKNIVKSDASSASLAFTGLGSSVKNSVSLQ